MSIVRATHRTVSEEAVRGCLEWGGAMQSNLQGWLQTVLMIAAMAGTVFASWSDLKSGLLVVGAKVELQEKRIERLENMMFDRRGEVRPGLLLPPPPAGG